MSKLFITHTPYHIILAAGIVCNDYKSECCDLIIFEDFDIQNIDIESIKRKFKNVYLFEGSQKKQSILSRKKNINKIKSIMGKNKYKDIYIYNDSFVEEQYVINIAKINNVNITYIEDGSAPYNSHFIKYNKIKLYAKKLLYDYRYKPVYILGSHPYINKYLFSWPSLIRKELREKEYIYEIKNSILEDGINIVYKNYIENTDINIKGMFIIIENSEFFLKKGSKLYDEYLKNIKDIVRIASNKEIEVYFKYHPREKNKFLNDIFKDVGNEIDKDLPSEIFFNTKHRKEIFLISIASTSLLSASKLLPKENIISIAEMINLKDNIVDVFKEIGINNSYKCIH